MADSLATRTQLANFLRRAQLNNDSADLALSIASAELAGATGITPWPPAAPVPDQLWSWSLQLAALIYTNPHGAERVTLGRLTLSWGAEARAKAEKIVEDARKLYASTSGPQGSFPPAECWPDPARAFTPTSSA